MTTSRNRMPNSLRILREWRLEGKSVAVKTLFQNSTNNEGYLLEERLFLKLRNYLIVEIIFNIAQRSEIIQGMSIHEVLKAKNNQNEDGLHYLYVEEHKTELIQPAIIYLETKISQSFDIHNGDTSETP